jgi:Mn2+/Fe2+ NRAMP family transporter
MDSTDRALPIAAAAPGGPEPERPPVTRAIALGLVTGAADDDPSAVGTYASAGAALGPAILWAPIALCPLIFTVVYLSSRLGQVSGQGLFGVIRDYYPRWLLVPLLVAVSVGNTVEAGADLGGMAAALQLFVPLPFMALVVLLAAGVLALQIFASYRVIRNTFRWLALLLCAYIGSALLAQPDLRAVLIGTLIPTLRFDREFLTNIVAMLGVSLSAYLYTWQSNEEVEEEIEQGRVTVVQRRGATREELRQSRRDILFGTAFSSVIAYFIVLATASTLFRAGQQITSAADAAKALQPLAGRAAGLLFAFGVVAVGVLAVPVMTAGAAYDVCQTTGWKHGLYARFRSAPRFYYTIVGFTVLAVCFNLLGYNPLRALVWAGVLQACTIPPLLVVILLATNSARVMGEQRNHDALNIGGWITVAITTAAALALAIVYIV